MPVASPSSALLSTVPVEELGVTALYKAYLRHDPAVREWYPQAPFAKHSPPKDYPVYRRAAVAKILEEQNRAWGAGEKTTANLQRFASGAAAIVTGQQVGLYGGPMYSLLKAITAIRMAEEQTRAGIETVPIFWLATEDHDLDEVRHAEVLTAEHELRRLQLSLQGGEARVGDVELPATISALNDELKSLQGENEITDLLGRCYAPGRTFADAFAKFFAEIFREYGLILMDNRDARFHAIAAPVFITAAEQAQLFNQSLQKRAQELSAAGFHAQVHIDASSTLLFHQQKGKRVAVKLDGSTFKAGKQEWKSAAELADAVRKAPEDFSANALLRPIVEDNLLPTTAYVGGAAEIAYFAQSQIIFAKILGRVTPIVPRASVTLIEPGVARLLERFKLEPQEAFIPAEEFRLRTARAQLPAGVQNAFAGVEAHLGSHLAELEERVAEEDPTLRDAARNAAKKMHYQLKRLSQRAARAHLRRELDMDRQVWRLSASLYPNGGLQERTITGAYFLAKYGRPLLELLHENLRVDTAEHQFIRI
jgi:bacillithiol biosynthesis cysteine-adding enzyme BshC